MCTLAVLWKCHPAAPLIVAQCRDEFLARPASDVEKWRTAGGVDVVSGRDLMAGGTWFGVGPHVVSALTNRRDERGPRRGKLSRGELVVSALEQRNVGDVEKLFTRVSGNDYGPFSLLACDGSDLVYCDNADVDGGVGFTRVAPGVHVLGNYGLDNDADPVVRVVGNATRALVDGGADEDALVDALRAILGRHGDGWPCVHVSEYNYGTRSAGVLVWKPATSSSRFWTHPSAPHDANGWRDSSALLK